MAPLEDELRTALRGRAATLTPSADPFAGVERRARGMRRRRVGASVAGTALAVLAVAGAVPALTPDRSAAPAPGEVASAAPTTAENPYALDPREPWPYRGDPSVREQLAAYQREWAVRHPGAELLPLFGQVYEPSGQPELVFASRQPGAARWWLGVAQTGEAGPVFRTVERGDPVNAVVLVLPGDEGTDRLLVVASPQAERLQYAADGERYEDLSPLADAVGTAAVQRAPGTADGYQVVGQGGLLLEQGAVDDEPASDRSEAVTGAPDNVQDWTVRGVPRGPDVLRARALYATGRGQVAAEDVTEKVLFAGSDDAGRHYLLGQFWVPGDSAADTVALVVPAQGEPELQLYRALLPGAGVAAMYLSPVNAQSRGELVVVPRPGTGQVEYAGDDASEWAPKDTPGLDGVVLLERTPAAERGEAVDRVRVLDGDGAVIAEATVSQLLCGKTSCG